MDHKVWPETVPTTPTPYVWQVDAMRSKLKVARELLEELLAEREEMEKAHEANTLEIQAQIEEQQAEVSTLRDEIRWTTTPGVGGLRHI